MTNAQKLQTELNKANLTLIGSFYTDDAVIYYDQLLSDTGRREVPQGKAEEVKLRAAIAHDCVILTHLQIKHIPQVVDGLYFIEIMPYE